MPPCDETAKKAQDRLNNRCNRETGRWVRKTRDDVMADLVKCRTKTQQKRELLKISKREIRTLKKVQALYYKLCMENAKLKVQGHLMQRHVNKLEDAMAAKKKRKPGVKKPPMKEYTAAERDAQYKEVAERQAARMDSVIQRQIEIWKMENPGAAIPVDFQEESDKLIKSKMTPVAILIPRKKVRA